MKSPSNYQRLDNLEKRIEVLRSKLAAHNNQRKQNTHRNFKTLDHAFTTMVKSTSPSNSARTHQLRYSNTQTLKNRLNKCLDSLKRLDRVRSSLPSSEISKTCRTSSSMSVYSSQVPDVVGHLDMDESCGSSSPSRLCSPIRVCDSSSYEYSSNSYNLIQESGSSCSRSSSNSPSYASIVSSVGSSPSYVVLDSSSSSDSSADSSSSSDSSADSSSSSDSSTGLLSTSSSVDSSAFDSAWLCF